MRDTEKQIVEMCQKKVISYAQVAYFSHQQWKKEWVNAEGIYSITTPCSLQFDIASLTKVLGTTPIILQLLQEKKIFLTDKVNQYLPIKNQDLEIIHLLTHTSNFVGYIPNRNQLPADQLEKALYKEMNPGDKLGSEVQYSDINFIYLGMIIEQIYQKPVQQVIEEEILKKCPLLNTTFYPVVQQCIPTDWIEKGVRRRGEVHDPKARILQDRCGSAGLFSTLDDLCVLLEEYLSLPMDSFVQTHLQKVWTKNAKGRTRSLGWVIEEKAKTLTLSHTGYTGMYLCWNKEKQKVFIFLSQRFDYGDNNATYLTYRDSLIEKYIMEENL